MDALKICVFIQVMLLVKFDYESEENLKRGWRNTSIFCVALNWISK